MQFRANAKVMASDGKHVGDLRRVVIDPSTNEVRDIVVRQGKLLSQDRVVPIEQVAQSDHDHVELRLNPSQVDALDPFEEQFYFSADGSTSDLPPDTLAPVSYWYPPLVGYTPPGMAMAATPDVLGYRLRRERHIPDNTVALKEGATVTSRDGHSVGRLEQVITAPGSDQATHIVLAEGHLNKTRTVVPLEWVQKINEAEVSLAVSAGLIERLPVYEPAV